MLLDDLSAYLATASFAYPVQKGQLLEIPDSVLALRETGGFPAQFVMGPTGNASQAVVDEPTLQVVTRSKDYLTAMTICRTAYDLLNGLRDITVNNVLYHLVRALQPPFFLMRDDNQRYLCAFNLHVTRRTI